MYEKSKYVKDVTDSVANYLGQHKRGLAIAGLLGAALVNAAAGNLDSVPHAVPLAAYDASTDTWVYTSKSVILPQAADWFHGSYELWGAKVVKLMDTPFFGLLEPDGKLELLYNASNQSTFRPPGYEM